MAGAVLELTEDNFQNEILDSEQVSLVDFWAPWCGPCRMLAPTIEELGEEKGDTYRIAKLNVDNAPNVAARYGISGIPTLLIFKGGEVVQRFTGVTSKPDLVKALEAAG